MATDKATLSFKGDIITVEFNYAPASLGGRDGPDEDEEIEIVSTLDEHGCEFMMTPEEDEELIEQLLRERADDGH